MLIGDKELLLKILTIIGLRKVIEICILPASARRRRKLIFRFEVGFSEDLSMGNPIYNSRGLVLYVDSIVEIHEIYSTNRISCLHRIYTEKLSSYNHGVYVTRYYIFRV